MKKYYKFLYEKEGKIVSSHKDFEWKIGKEYSVTGDIRNCNRSEPTNGLHASEQPLDALKYVGGHVIATVEARGDSDNEDDKVCFRSMRIVKAYRWTTLDSVAFAIYAAEQVIKVYEDKYPNDSRPRDAIKAAKAYLKDPTKDNARAAYAADAAAYAARAAYAADAAEAAAYAAYAAYAAEAAARAAYAAYAAINAKLNRWIKNRIKKLEEIK